MREFMASTLDRVARLLIIVAIIAAFLLLGAPLALIRPAYGQEAGRPPPSAELQSAMERARGGDAAALTARAEAGDAEAQAALGNLYFRGLGGATPDLKSARKWYEKAAAQGHAQANRTLGEMYAKGQGGRKNTKKAAELWIAAEKAGDPLAATLLADQLFSEITGGKTPGPGQYAFRGGVPVADVDMAIAWYKEAQVRDPRPEARDRAAAALNALQTFKAAAQVKVGETAKP